MKEYSGPGTLSELSRIVKEELSEKQNVLTAGENISIVKHDGKTVISSTGGVSSLPPGGTTGQVLVKASDADGDAVWATVSGVSTLDGLTIATPPNKVKYKPGETFDPTGMTVLASFSNGTTTPIDNSSLTFSPDEPLDESVTFITVSFASGGLTVTAQQPITVSGVNIYGAIWDGTSTTAWTRTDNAALFVDPTPAVSNGSGSSPFDGLMPWAGMTRVTDSAAGELVKIPKFWFMWTKSGNTLKLQIADAEIDGFHVSPAHMDRGDGKGERDVVYVGRYHCVNGYKSLTNQEQLVNITRSTARDGIKALGTGIWQWDMAMRVTIQMLYLVEYADWNSQAKIGYGCSETGSKENNGKTDAMQYHTGTTAANRTTYGYTQYRHIEGLWDNVYDWMDGGYYNDSGLNIIINPNQFSDTANGTLVGLPVDGYPTVMSVGTQSGLEWVIYPITANGSDSTCVPDYWYFNASDPCLGCGGDYSQGQSHGMFYVGCVGVTYASASVGSRLQKLP